MTDSLRNIRDKKIVIKDATSSDCEDVYVWRCDPISLSVSFDNSIPSYQEHEDWFNSSLNNADRKMYIGEVDSFKIGVCRFDRNKKNSTVEVSINMNPKFRGLGFGKRFLASSIEYFQNEHRNDLLAKIKPKNLSSLNIFKSLGFKEISSKEDNIILVKTDKKISFKEVDENDTDVLFDLLTQRVHSISHIKIPKRSEHQAFVKSYPYRHWAVIYEDDYPIGTFYLQDNNSVGLNINEPSLFLLSKVLMNLQEKFEPLREVKSKVPPYFYINVPFDNEKLRELLHNLDSAPIQISYKI